MARKYALGPKFGSGIDVEVKTYVGGDYVPPGSVLPSGTTEFDLLVFMRGPDGELVSFQLTVPTSSQWKTIIDHIKQAYEIAVSAGDFGYRMGGNYSIGPNR